jgi:GT2 family glycosyltransferase
MNNKIEGSLHPKISFIGPSHRTWLWKTFYESIITNLNFEVIFVTDVEPNPADLLVNPYFLDEKSNYFFYEKDNFKWIYSKVKPAQCFEIAYRHSTGDFIIWTGDDFVYSPYALDHAYNMYRSFHDHKIIVSFNVYQDGLSAKHEHKMPWDDSIQLTTTALINKKAIEEVGGFGDINFVCGHFDVDLMMRIIRNGGKLFICPTAIAYEPHNQFHKEEANFSYDWADELEYIKKLWRGKHIEKDVYETLSQRSLPFQPYSDQDILTISQGNIGKTGKWK